MKTSKQYSRNMRRGFGLVLISLVVFTLAYSWYSWHKFKQSETNRLSLLAELESKSLESFFNHFEITLGLLTQDLQSKKIPMDGEAAHQLLKRYKQANPELVNIIIERPDGQIIASALNPPGSKLPTYAKESSYLAGRAVLLAGRNFDIGRPTFGKLINEWVLPLRFAMRDARGQLQYIVAATLPVSRQQHYWRSLYLPREDVFGLLRDDGYLLSLYPLPVMHEQGELYGNPRNGATIQYLKENAFPLYGVAEGKTGRNAHSIVTFHRLGNFPVTFFIDIPVGKIWASWWKSSQAFYAMAGILLLGCVGIYFWLARRQAALDVERELANKKIIEANRAKDVAEKELLALELDDVKQALDQHSIISIADVSGKIIYGNDKFCAVSGYSSEELLGQDHRILNSGLHSRKFFIDMWHTIASGNVWHGQFRNRAKDGTFYWVDSTIVPFLDKQGKPYQYVSVRTDITAYIKARAAAEAANKAKSQFLSSMSHELRTPLNAILGFGQVLEMQIGQDNKDQAESVRHIVMAGNQLLGLINDLLDLSRIEIGKLEFNLQPVALSELAMISVNMVAGSQLNKKHVTIQNAITDDTLAVMGDALRIRQVLINLLGNAVKYNRENGTVTLACEVLDGQARILVKDTGLGIARDKLPLLYGHFERLDQKHGTIEGAGIGLYMCKHLVEAMHGQVGVESVEGVGSTFWFTLPLAGAAGRREQGH